MTTIQVEIVTPSRQLYNGEAQMVTMPGIEGRMGVLGGHAPLLTTLNIGEITLHQADGETEYLAVSGGVVEVRPDKVIILARSAERADEIDVARAEAARQRAEEALRTRPAAERRPVEGAYRRSLLRLQVARRRRTRPPGLFVEDEE